MQKRRRRVPCECRECGRIKHVSQEERRMHLKRQTALFARLQELASQNASTSTALSPPDSQPYTTSLPQAIVQAMKAAFTGADETMDGNAGLEDPPLITNPLPVLQAEPPGTPLSPSRSAALRALEEQAGEAIASILAQSRADEGPIGEPLMDDDWEDPADSDNERDNTIAQSHSDVGSSCTPQHTLAPTTHAEARLPLGEPRTAIVPLSESISTPGAAEHSTTQRQIPVACGVPQHKLDENEPDPFNHEGRSIAPSVIASSSEVHPQQGMYLLYMLVTWLHLQFHLPFCACSALIGIVVLILRAFGNTIEPSPITTLPRIMSKLQVEPVFDILPVCPSCLEVYPAVSTPPNYTRCAAPIFKAQSSMPQAKPVPLLCYPSQSIESQLTSLLAVPGIEEALDGWRKIPRSAGKYVDIFDGKIPKNLKAVNGEKFFRNDPQDWDTGPNGEIRIGLTLGMDW